MKAVFQMDDFGVYVGVTVADPSPLQAGAWLIPRGCVEVAPPQLQDNQLARWNGSEWVVEDIPAPPEPVPPAPMLTREALCVALIGVGILTEAEAEEAALGAWPAKFEPALAGKALVEKFEAKNQWRGISFVPRDAPLFVDLLAFYAAAAGLDEAGAQALADLIFEGAQ